MTVSSEEPSEARPVYEKAREDETSGTPTYMITCDEGWRRSIVCTGMYGWSADWLLTLLGNRPYAEGFRPGP